jgi:probable addiction module antidote protein
MTETEKQRVRTRPFDVANYLGSEEEIAKYLELVLEDNDSTLLAAALGDIARARGMTQLAKDTGLSRESHYRSLSGERVPSGDTLLPVIHACGFRLGVQPQVTK